jgi:riboflavin kinase/FMN adenylyltransferase
MELVRGLSNCRPDGRGSALVIGNVDGVHLGHQALLRAAREAAAASGARLTVLTFEPHPRECLAPATAPARLMRFREKVRALAANGVERVVVGRFDDAFRQLSPEAFIDAVLVGRLGARHVVVGEGFRFGAAQAGAIPMLAAAGVGRGFEVRVVPSVVLGGERVSSTAVRAALAAGRLEHAAALLGRPYVLGGRVVQGQQLGRTLGYPTANLRLHRARLPLAGIFAVRVHGVAGSGPLAAVASLGTRPTVGGVEPLLEVHVFDFKGDLYGQRLDVEFVAKLRDEERFDSLAALVTQMDDDAARARALLGLKAA